MKKILLVIALPLIVGALLQYKAFSDASDFECHCPFCDEGVLGRQMIYENNLITVLYSHKPILEGHCLIIPKRHIRTFLDLSSEEFAAVQDAVHKIHRAVGKESFLLLQKNGVEVGQSVPHVHFHYIPRDKGKTSSLPVLLKFFFSPLLPPLSAIPRVLQNLANSEVGAPQFDQAKPTAKQGSVLHSPDAAGSKSGDADTGIGQVLNHEGYKVMEEHRKELAQLIN